MLNEEFLIPSDEGLKSNTAPWPSRLSFDLAMGDSAEAVMERYAIGPSQMQYLFLNPAFQLELQNHKERILAEGISFKTKAKLQAEDYLTDIDELIHDPETSPAVRLDAIKSVVTWAGYGEKKSDSVGGGSATRMVISWADGSGQVAIESKPNE